MKRIQRKRTKGWKMPANTVYVGRPTKWGNPFKIGYTGPSDASHLMTRDDVLREYELYLRQKIRVDTHFLDPLKGKDLACWCPLGKPCHADVILKMLEVV